MKRPSTSALAGLAGLACLACLAAFAGLASSACDKRVDEPELVGPRRSAALEEKPWGTRCVREAPKRPLRVAPPSPDPRCPNDPDKPPALRTGKVTFGDTSIDVEIAEREQDRERGLMYRKSMAPDHGMIFWSEKKTNQTFWMHNTCIPLDMVFLDDDGLVVGIEENTPTMSDSTFQVGCASRYVLELNAGYAKAHGITPGRKARIEGI